MKTYQEVAPTIVFPETVEEPLQQTIYEWFKYREVCDDDKFNVFFIRVLNENIRRYEQILRVEPGVAEYDWLVQRYLESQTIDNGSGTKTAKDNRTTGFGGGTLTSYGGSDSHVTEYGKSEKSGGAETGNTSQTNELSRELSGTTKETEGRTTEDTGVLSSKTVTGSKTVTTNDDRHLHADTTNYRGEKGGAGDTGEFYTDTTGFVVNDQKGLAKNNPMSVSYPSTTADPYGLTPPSVDLDSPTGGAYGAGSSLDWTSPSSQTQQYGRDITHTKVLDHRGKEHSDTDTYYDKDGAKGLTEVTSYDDDYADTDTVDKTQTVDVTKDGSKSETSLESGKRADSEARQYTSENSTSGSDTNTDSYGKTVTTSDNRLQSATGNASETNVTENRHRLRHTGRYTAPAQLLQQAVSYIMTTDAWEWLYKRLDVCFMGIYD